MTQSLKHSADRQTRPRLSWRSAGVAILALVMIGLASTARATEPSLADLVSLLGLPRLHWGQSTASVGHAAPSAVKGPPCGWGSHRRPPALHIPDWRSGGFAGELCLGVGHRGLRSITFDGMVGSRAEEEALVRAIIALYGLPRSNDFYDGDRTISYFSEDTYIEYTSTPKENSFHYSIHFVDLASLTFIGQEEFGELIDRPDMQ